MRISDWSSDVCSSDLASARSQWPGHHHRLDAKGRSVRRGSADPERRRRGAGRSILRSPHPCHVSERSQIGRASCRGKGVSVSVDLGGRRIIKNNNTTCIDTYRYTPTQTHESAENKTI